MRRTLSLAVTLWLAAYVRASALTAPIPANARQCYYADVDKAGEKLGVRVSRALRLANSNLPRSSTLLFVPLRRCSTKCNALQVQSGGSFDIDFEIKDPKGKILLTGQRERQGDYVFTANNPGEYEFCFENDMSTLTEKLVDFDIMVESEPRRDIPLKPGQIADQTSALEESIYRLSNMLQKIKRTQQ